MGYLPGLKVVKHDLARPMSSLKGKSLSRMEFRTSAARAAARRFPLTLQRPAAAGPPGCSDPANAEKENALRASRNGGVTCPIPPSAATIRVALLTGTNKSGLFFGYAFAFFLLLQIGRLTPLASET